MRRGSTIGNRIRFLRELVVPPMTPTELDRLAGFRRGHVGMLEVRGSLDHIEARTIHCIAEVFGLAMEWIYKGNGRAPLLGDISTHVARARRAAAARDKVRERPTGTAA